MIILSDFFITFARKNEKLMMKKSYFLTMIALVFMLAMCFSSCASSQLSKAEKAAQQARVVQAVADSLDRRSFTIEVNHVNPQRMPSRMLTYGYGLKIRDGELIESYLPFFGRVYRAEFGEQTGLNFSDKIVQYQSAKVKKDCYAVELVVRRKLEMLVYRIDIFDNGRATISVRSDNRDSMFFSGEMIVGE